MGALVQTIANNAIDASVATASFVAITAPIHCRLMTTNGTATSAGVELTTGGNYTSGTGAPTLTFAAAASGSAASDSAVTITTMPAPAGGSIVGVELWDSNGTPKRLWWGALTAPKAVSAGDTFTIASGSLTLTLN